ncbi:MAG: hypothetical protein J6U54_16020 [Clostridiales bacterium]|nr:hypothetical protein [Clostridiales bacterium]
MDKILLVRINEDGKREPYEVWDAQRARVAALNIFEMNEICSIMDDIQSEAYHELDRTYWRYNPEKLTNKSRNKIIKYLTSLGYEVKYVSKNIETNVQTYRINW